MRHWRVFAEGAGEGRGAREGDEPYGAGGFCTCNFHCPALFSRQSCPRRPGGTSKICTGCLSEQRLKRACWFFFLNLLWAWTGRGGGEERSCISRRFVKLSLWTVEWLFQGHKGREGLLITSRVTPTCTWGDSAAPSPGRCWVLTGIVLP